MKEYVPVADDCQPAAPAAGALEDSVNMYPVTPTLSVAVKVEMEMVSVVAVAGMVKAVTVGAVASGVLKV